MAEKQGNDSMMGNGGENRDLSITNENPEILLLESDEEAGAVETGGPHICTSRSDCGSRQPPPFLQKIYDMLENDDVNYVATWDPTGTSLVIRNHHLFAANVLPLYFKHCNFQSFITQLNSYGFKKTSWDQWEYKNEHFRKGEKHLLKNIKRRSQVSHKMQQASKTEPSRESSSCSNTEKGLEMLMDSHRILKMEIMKLKENQLALEQKLALAIKSKAKNQTRMILSEACRVLKKQKDLRKRKMDEKTDEIQSNKRTMCSDSGSSDAISVEKILELVSDDKGKRVLVEDETEKHESSTFMSLEELIGESSDWIEFIREVKEKASKSQNLDP